VGGIILRGQTRESHKPDERPLVPKAETLRENQLPKSSEEKKKRRIRKRESKPLAKFVSCFYSRLGKG